LCDARLPVYHPCPKKKRSGSRPTVKIKREPEPECRHLGPKIDDILCKSCGGEKKVPVFECAVHGRCHRQFVEDDQGIAGERCSWCRKRGKGFEAAQ
jgi:hypothetical protein